MIFSTFLIGLFGLLSFLYISSNSSRGLGKVDKFVMWLPSNQIAEVFTVYKAGDESWERWTTNMYGVRPGGQVKVVHRLSSILSPIDQTWQSRLSPSNPQVFHKEVL
jgi:hypothetical protein